MSARRRTFTPGELARAAGLGLVSILLACGGRAPAEAPAAPANPASPPASPEAIAIPPHVEAAVSATDRSDPDRELDAGRHPAETLAFFGIQAGWRVAEIGAGGGYTTELLARVVGPKGVVFAQNSQSLLDKFAGAVLEPRLTKAVNANVVKVVREFEDPLPPEAKELDAVLDVLFYHDTVWLGVDRDKMNRAVFTALRPGGIYGIVDHSAKDGAGVTVVKELHRIDQRVVKEEIERAGFRFAGEAHFLRNPRDPRDWNDSPKAAGDRRGTSDRFVLKFVKP
jgi:predicted methyltransferase